MKPLTAPEIDRYRFTHPMAPDIPDEFRAWVGAFEVPFTITAGGAMGAVYRHTAMLRCIVSRGGAPEHVEIDPDANRWDHLSVSTPTRCPTWEEMEFLKRLFFERDECAMQLHVPPRDHVDNHPFCLHIWRPLDVEIPRPPSIMVGDQRLGRIA
jgi:hypothetical protein